MEGHQKTETILDVRLSGIKTGAGPAMKKERLKHSLCLSKVFKSNPREKENKLLSDDTTSVTVDTPTKLFTIKEISVKKSQSKTGAGLRTHNQLYCRSCQKWEDTPPNYKMQSLDGSSNLMLSSIPMEGKSAELAEAEICRRIV
jgi:hypothetical protein